MLWNNLYTAYLKPVDGNWQRWNLRTKEMRNELEMNIDFSEGVSGQNNKFWTTPKNVFSIVCFNRDLRPIFLYGGNKKIKDAE